MSGESNNSNDILASALGGAIGAVVLGVISALKKLTAPKIVAFFDAAVARIKKEPQSDIECFLPDSLLVAQKDNIIRLYESLKKSAPYLKITIEVVDNQGVVIKFQDGLILIVRPINYENSFEGQVVNTDSFKPTNKRFKSIVKNTPDPIDIEWIANDIRNASCIHTQDTRDIYKSKFPQDKKKNKLVQNKIAKDTKSKQGTIIIDRFIFGSCNFGAKFVATAEIALISPATVNQQIENIAFARDFLYQKAASSLLSMSNPTSTTPVVSSTPSPPNRSPLTIPLKSLDDQNSSNPSAYLDIAGEGTTSNKIPDPTRSYSLS